MRRRSLRLVDVQFVPCHRRANRPPFNPADMQVQRRGYIATQGPHSCKWLAPVPWAIRGCVELAWRDVIPALCSRQARYSALIVVDSSGIGCSSHDGVAVGQCMSASCSNALKAPQITLILTANRLFCANRSTVNRRISNDNNTDRRICYAKSNDSGPICINHSGQTSLDVT